MDIAKGIAILAVVAGHLYPPSTLVGRVIYSFHMPLFFLISGYFIKDFNIRKNLKSSFKGLLIPYIVGTLLEMIAVICLEGGAKGLKSAADLFLDMIGGFCKDPVAFPMFHETWILWFLPSLFLAKIIFAVIMKITESNKNHTTIRLIVIAILAFVAMLSPMSMNEYFPWGIEISLVALPFLLSGYMFNQQKLFANRFRFLIAGICFVFWVCLLCAGFYIELAAHYWPGFYLAVIEGIAASFAVICFSQLADRVAVINTFFRWVGKNSLIILLAHNLDTRYIHIEAFFGLNAEDDRLFVLIVQTVFVLCIAAASGAVSYFWQKKRERPDKSRAVRAD